MKVYFLHFCMNYDGDHHLGVFSSKDLAEEYKEILIQEGTFIDNESLDWRYIIDEYDLDSKLQTSSRTGD